MQKFLLITVLLIATFSLKAQKNIQDVNEVNFYGIDFSLVSVVGSDETEAQFKEAFSGINALMIAEPKKYDFEKSLKKDINLKDLDAVSKNNDSRDYSTLKVWNEQEIPNEDIKMLIKNYNLKESDGTGLVLIAKTLDKGNKTAVYDVVFFDIGSRDIIYKQTATGKSGGFGLRNYWAASIYQILKSWKY